MKTSAVLSVVGLALTLSTAHAADMRAQIGQKKISMCIGCHGIPGYRTAFPEVYSVPKLGGQHAAYIVAALKAYRSGERDHADMRSIANSLSDRDMEEIAAYYAKAK